jgi:hypothetical protein
VLSSLSLPNEESLFALLSQSKPFSKKDRLAAHLATFIATNYGYSPSVIREKIRSASFLPSNIQISRDNPLPLTSLVLAGYAKDYRPARKRRMALFGDLEEVLYRPFDSLPPEQLLPRVVRTFSRIMRVGMLRGGEGLFNTNRVDFLDRYISLASLHINGQFFRDFANPESLAPSISHLLKLHAQNKLSFWGFNLSHSKTDQKGVGFRLDLTPGDVDFPILYDTLDMIRRRHQDGEVLNFDFPLFAYRTCSTGSNACTVVLSYNVFLKIDTMLSNRFGDKNFKIRPHSRRSGFTSEMLRLNVPVHKIKVLLRHSNGAIDRYIEMPPLEKVRLQNLTLKRRFVGLNSSSAAERRIIDTILVSFFRLLFRSSSYRFPPSQLADQTDEVFEEETEVFHFPLLCFPLGCVCLYSQIPINIPVYITFVKCQIHFIPYILFLHLSPFPLFSSGVTRYAPSFHTPFPRPISFPPSRIRISLARILCRSNM